MVEGTAPPTARQGAALDCVCSNVMRGVAACSHDKQDRGAAASLRGERARGVRRRSETLEAELSCCEAMQRRGEAVGPQRLQSSADERVTCMRAQQAASGYMCNAFLSQPRLEHMQGHGQGERGACIPAKR